MVTDVWAVLNMIPIYAPHWTELLYDVRTDWPLHISSYCQTILARTRTSIERVIYDICRFSRIICIPIPPPGKCLLPYRRKKKKKNVG